jgi:hypothetical protein
VAVTGRLGVLRHMARRLRRKRRAPVRHGR